MRSSIASLRRALSVTSLREYGVASLVSEFAWKSSSIFDTIFESESNVISGGLFGGNRAGLNHKRRNIESQWGKYVVLD
jgi:hypothetical protein